MLYYIANQDFQNFKKYDIVAKFNEFIPNEFTSSKLVEVIEEDDHQFPKVIFQEGSPEKYTNGEITTEIKPEVIDDSWTKIDGIVGYPSEEDISWNHNPAQTAIEAQAEYWENDYEIVYENPNNEFYVHHEAISAQDAVVESWTKDNQIVYIQPMIEGVNSVPEHWVKDGFEANYTQPVKLDSAYTIISAIEAKNTIINDSVAQEYYVKSRILSESISRGQTMQTCCNNVVAYIADNNDTRGLTPQQINLMMSTFSTAYTFLNNTMPNSAKAEIIAVVPDGVLVTQDMKDDIIRIIESFNF